MIREIEPRRNIKGKLIKYGEFLCPILNCNKLVERQLDNGKRSKSCGCLKLRGNIKHGWKGTRLYEIWVNMKQRILNPINTAYKNYGKKGITICDEWLKFIPFKNWSLNHGYMDNLEIDRIENDKGYYPENCHFVLSIENAQNRSTTKLTLKLVNEIRIKYDSGYYTQKQLSIEYNVSVATINLIINKKSWKNENN